MKILIDNGHGNNTPGKRSPYSANGIKPAIEFYEYEWNREIAARIVDDLLSMGYDAELLVPEDNDISLKERVRRINEICDTEGASNTLMISVHANAMGDGSAWMKGRGWSAYTTKGDTISDNLADCLYKAAEYNLSGMKIRKDFSDGDPDWEANFYICKKAKCAAVLTENFFYDNTDDLKFILSNEGKDAIVRTHIDGIVEYVESKFCLSAKTPPDRARIGD